MNLYFLNGVQNAVLPLSSGWIGNPWLKTWEEHLCHIRLVLESLSANGLTAKPSKCVWAANKVEYLGFVVGDGQASVPEARVAALRSFK